jgi:hypothetical protein
MMEKLFGKSENALMMEQIKGYKAVLKESDFKEVAEIIDMKKFTDLIRLNALTPAEVNIINKAVQDFNNALLMLKRRQIQVKQYYEKVN